MSPYEIVRRAIEFEHPERLPLRFEELGISDVHTLHWNQFRPYDHDYREPATDEWGCVWRKSEVHNMGQVKGHPLGEVGALDHYHWPDPDNPAFYLGMEQALAGCNSKYVLADIFMLLFERIQALRGFENTLIDLLDRPNLLERIADAVIAFDLQVIENLGRRFKGAIHGFAFTDDWGSEKSLLISPQHWAKLFKPRYGRIFSAIHQQGWHIWMHSCGKINDIIEELIDIGLDVINLQQPRALGIQEIGRRFGGRLCFETLCDIQRTLPAADHAEIRRESKELLDNWAVAGGGFILSDYGDGEAIGVDPEKKRAMLEAFLEFDPWKAKQAEGLDGSHG